MSGGHGKIEGFAMCPVCERELPLCDSTDFGISFRVNSTIKDAIDQHCKTHEHEPLWNFLPTLALKPTNWGNRRREKVTSGDVRTFIDYTLRKAGRAIPLPTAFGTWLDDWRFTKYVLLSRLSFAREQTSDPSSFMKDWTNVVAGGNSNGDKRAWIRRVAKNYLQQLIENVMTSNLASGEKWAMASIHRRRNLFQLFFLQGNHRECGLLRSSLFPDLPDENCVVAAAETKTEDIGDDESDDAKPFPDVVVC